LYAPADSVMAITPLGEELRALASSVLSRAAVHRFLGYLDAQLQRLLGNGRFGAPNRPELVALHGYDVKYASHALRLAYQGLEVARDGRLTLPMPEPERARVLAVKRGDVRRLDDVLAAIADVRARIEAAVDDSPLPAEPDVDAISAWSVSAHRRQWGWA
jgi:hypothetical protein